MERADVIILGGGMIGLTLAVALDRHGLSSIVVDPMDPQTMVAPGFDGRATAMSSSSWRMFEAIGIGEQIKAQGCPINAIQVSDGLRPGGLLFEPGQDEGPLGIMFENRLLRTALRDAAEAAPN